MEVLITPLLNEKTRDEVIFPKGRQMLLMSPSVSIFCKCPDVIDLASKAET